MAKRSCKGREVSRYMNELVSIDRRDVKLNVGERTVPAGLEKTRSFATKLQYTK